MGETDGVLGRLRSRKREGPGIGGKGGHSVGKIDLKRHHTPGGELEKLTGGRRKKRN